MNINQDTINSIYSQSITKVFVELLEIVMDTETLRLVNDFTPLTYGGNVYLPSAFSITPPEQKDTESNATLNFAGLTNGQIELVQSYTGSVVLRAALIRRDDLSQLIEDFIEYKVENINIDASEGSLSMTLTTGGMWGSYVSSDKYDVGTFPGMFG